MEAIRCALSTALIVSVSAGCHYPRTPVLERYDLGAGYRFDSLQVDRAGRANSDELFVVLAFSGGGTRAAALSYGVLEELDRVRFRLDPTSGEPCSDVECPSVPQRSLLDEVDVISSVSGGSFTAAYYALRGREILEPTSPFKTRFLYHPVQRELASKLAFNPANWRWLGSRVELAAAHFEGIFGDATFADLEARPYLILNSTDASTGGRFEFSQEQFDLLCADLDQFPLRRAVTASGAFPGLLNSMTIDSYQPANERCGYTGPGPWLQRALASRTANYERYRRAREVEGYLDVDRRHIHVLDGGVADNVGLRAVLRSLSSLDTPLQETDDPNQPIDGGWSLLRKINRSTLPGAPQIKNIIVISVNARTRKTNDWDRKRSGPSTLSLLNAATGIPIGRLSYESAYRLRAAGFDGALNQPGRPGYYGFEVAFENIDDARERDFFLNLGTNFQLSPFDVECLIERGASLLRTAISSTEARDRSFVVLVDSVLKGNVVEGEESGKECTAAEAEESGDKPFHIANMGIHYSFATGTRESVRLKDRLGVSLRLARPSSLGVLFSVGPRSFEVEDRVLIQQSLGDLRLWAVTAGLGYTFRWGHFDLTPGVTTGYAFGDFELEDGVRQTLGEQFGVFDLAVKAPGSWMWQGEVHAWYEMSSRFALTGFAQYMYAEPSIELAGPTTVLSRDLRASGVRLGAGLGLRVP